MLGCVNRFGNEILIKKAMDMALAYAVPHKSFSNMQFLKKLFLLKFARVNCFPYKYLARYQFYVTNL